jgi:hypothetical protein
MLASLPEHAPSESTSMPEFQKRESENSRHKAAQPLSMTPTYRGLIRRLGTADVVPDYYRDGAIKRSIYGPVRLQLAKQHSSPAEHGQVAEYELLPRHPLTTCSHQLTADRNANSTTQQTRSPALIHLRLVLFKAKLIWNFVRF